MKTKDGPPQRAVTKAPEPTPVIVGSGHIHSEQREEEQPKTSLVESIISAEFMERFQKDDFTFSRLILEKIIQVYCPSWGRPIDPDRSEDRAMIAHQFNLPSDMRFFAELRIAKEEVERFQQRIKKEEPPSETPKRQRYVEPRNKCRKKARSLWEKHPKTSLKDMARRHELGRVCENLGYKVVEDSKSKVKDVSCITFRTIEDWIKEERPEYRG